MKKLPKHLEVMLFESSYHLHLLLKNESSELTFFSRNGDWFFFLFLLPPFDKRDDEEREKKIKTPKIFGRYALKFLPFASAF